MHLLDGAVVETGLAFKEAEPVAAEACRENDRADRVGLRNYPQNAPPIVQRICVSP
jgi:hypothetical protein